MEESGNPCSRACRVPPAAGSSGSAIVSGELHYSCAFAGLPLAEPRIAQPATEAWNLATLCRGHHDWKTVHPLEARPPLIAYLERVEPSAL